MKLSEAIRTIGGDISGIDPALHDRDVEGFAVDSRKVKAGDVFLHCPSRITEITDSTAILTTLRDLRRRL